MTRPSSHSFVSAADLAEVELNRAASRSTSWCLTSPKAVSNETVRGSIPGVPPCPHPIEDGLDLFYVGIAHEPVEGDAGRLPEQQPDENRQRKAPDQHDHPENEQLRQGWSSDDGAVS
jgi:hypothetical protein